MNQDEKKWSFTEILGWTDDVENVIQELKNEGILHGSLCSIEEKDDKRFVQYYECNGDVCLLTPREISIYNEIAFRNFVHIEFTYNGRDCMAFPLNAQDSFPIKYWEWWITE